MPGRFAIRLKGDVNGDCSVDISDLALIGTSFGKTSLSLGYNPYADINNDGVIDITDMTLVAGTFGQAC